MSSSAGAGGLWFWWLANCFSLLMFWPLLLLGFFQLFPLALGLFSSCCIFCQFTDIIFFSFSFFFFYFFSFTWPMTLISPSSWEEPVDWITMGVGLGASSAGTSVVGVWVGRVGWGSSVEAGASTKVYWVAGGCCPDIVVGLTNGFGHGLWVAGCLLGARHNKSKSKQLKLLLFIR